MAPRLCGYSGAAAAVYSQVHEVVVFFVVADEIIVIIVPQKGIGAYLEAAFSRFKSVFPENVFKIAKLDLFTGRYRGVKCLDYAVQRVVGAFGTVVYADPAAERLGFVDTDLLFKPRYKIAALFCRNKFRRLHRVYKQADLRYAELPLGYKVAVIFAAGFYRNADRAQSGDI